MNELAKCRKCGSPILGNEWFCSHCGKRVTGRSSNGVRPLRPPGARPLLWGLVALAVLGAVAAAMVFGAVRHLSRSIDARAGGAVSRVARSVATMAHEEKRDASFGCSLLSRDDAASIAGTAVTRTETASDSCSYFGIPDPSLNPEAIAMKSAPGVAQDSQASKMIDQVAGAMRGQVEAQDPNTRAGPGGERLLFAIHDTAALSASFEAARSVAGTPMGGEAVPGIGDEACFTAMHRMLFVRKGPRYLLVQPQFVKDPRGVAIAAARKVLASPDF